MPSNTDHSDSLSLVFTYGTLKVGEPNHYLLKDPTYGMGKFYANARTVEQFPLVIATKYNIPFLLDAPNIGKEVFGEVFCVDRKMLARLDELEEHPDFYVREKRPVKIGSKIEYAYMYLMKNFHPHLLDEPWIENYNLEFTKRNFKPYTMSYLRDPSYSHRSEVMPSIDASMNSSPRYVEIQ